MLCYIVKVGALPKNANEMIQWGMGRLQNAGIWRRDVGKKDSSIKQSWKTGTKTNEKTKRTTNEKTFKDHKKKILVTGLRLPRIVQLSKTREKKREGGGSMYERDRDQKVEGGGEGKYGRS